jgi:Na+-transporting methylmalonyl-CoA/oxaloacetate decarboxylase gamma subunit
MTANIFQGFIITINGIFGVFIVLGILAFFMWLLGVISKKEQIQGYEVREEDTERIFSEKEIIAIISAIQHFKAFYETGVREVKTSENWRKYARIEQVR